jgi:hypothetical protein
MPVMNTMKLEEIVEIHIYFFPNKYVALCEREYVILFVNGAMLNTVMVHARLAI